MKTTGEFYEEYMAACHAMQSGVAMKMNIDTNETTPKHLRVGVNAAMVEFDALTKLLFDKGIITELEFAEALAAAMREEVNKYEDELGFPRGTFI